MNSKMLRNTIVASGVVAAIVVASLLATGAGLTHSGNTAVRAAATSSKLPRPLGRGERPLSAGLHVLDLVALDTTGTGPAHLPKIAITLPSGWRSYGGFVVQKFHGPTQVMGLSFWDVAKVYGTPCRWQSKGLVDPGTTVGGLAAALASQPLRSATTPTDVVLAGARGKYLRLTVPKHIDFARCDRGSFESWTGLGWASDRWEQGPGELDRLWILNVDGQRLVVDAGYLPAATTKDRAELDRVVHSIRFLPVAAKKSARAAAATGRTSTHWPPACSATGPYYFSVGGLMASVKTGDIREKLWGNICGWSRKVTPGVSYDYTVVVTNINDVKYRTLTLAVTHYDPFTRTSLPYRREPAANRDAFMQGAFWTFRNVKPGRSIRVSFALPFRHHMDPIGSNFEVDAFAPGRRLLYDMTHDVVFAGRSS